LIIITLKTNGMSLKETEINKIFISIALAVFLVLIISFLPFEQYEFSKKRFNEDQWEDLVEYADSVRRVSNKSLETIIKEYGEQFQK